MPSRKEEKKNTHIHSNNNLKSHAIMKDSGFSSFQRYIFHRCFIFLLRFKFFVTCIKKRERSFQNSVRTSASSTQSYRLKSRQLWTIIFRSILQNAKNQAKWKRNEIKFINTRFYSLYIGRYLCNNWKFIDEMATTAMQS